MKVKEYLLWLALSGHAVNYDVKWLLIKCH